MNELEQFIADYRFDAVLNCSSPYWDENVIISGLKNDHPPVIASIFYDVISLLRRLYEECLFAVYPSLDESYGLPCLSD